MILSFSPIVAAADQVEVASDALFILAVLFSVLFFGLILATVTRHISHKRAVVEPNEFKLENLFNEKDIADLSRRLDVTAAASATEIDPGIVDVLNNLVELNALVVAIRSDVVWATDGSKQRVVTVVFSDTTTLRFAVPDYDILDSLDPSRRPRLDHIGVSAEQNITLMFVTQRDNVSVEVSSVVEVRNY